MCVGKPALDLNLGPKLLLWAQGLAGRCGNSLPAILDVFGAFRSLMKGRVPFWYHPALCSCLFLWPRVGVWRGDDCSPPLRCASGDWAQAQLLEPLLSPCWTPMSPSHWILYPVSVYININIYIYKLCTKGMPHCCGGCCPYMCGLSP